jgi:hypothetical protein
MSESAEPGQPATFGQQCWLLVTLLWQTEAKMAHIPDNLERALHDLGNALQRAMASLELAELDGTSHPRLSDALNALDEASTALVRAGRLTHGLHDPLLTLEDDQG